MAYLASNPTRKQKQRTRGLEGVHVVPTVEGSSTKTTVHAPSHGSGNHNAVSIMERGISSKGKEGVLVQQHQGGMGKYVKERTHVGPKGRLATSGHQITLKEWIETHLIATGLVSDDDNMDDLEDMEEFKPKVVALFETRISGWKANKIIKILNFVNSFRVEAHRFCCGIWLLWDDTVDMEISTIASQFAHGRFKSVNKQDWTFFTLIYASLDGAVREDFNSIVSLDERRGGSTKGTLGSKAYEESSSVFGVTQAVEGGGKVERKFKRIRTTGGDNISEEEAPRKSWRDTLISPSLLSVTFKSRLKLKMKIQTKRKIGKGMIFRQSSPPRIKIKTEKNLEKGSHHQDFRQNCCLQNPYQQGDNPMEIRGAKILMEGPWKIMDHYITVQRWRPNFVVANASIPSTTVWIHIPGLPIEYFEESVLCNLGRLVGKHLKIDYHTAWSTRGRFARICVEIDLNTPLLSKVRIGNKVYNIEYEVMHSICFKCGVVGHRATDCLVNQMENPITREVNRETKNQDQQEMQEEEENKKNQREEKEVTQDRYGPWMLVQRRQHGSRINLKNQRSRNQQVRQNNRNCRELIRDENPTIICLLETKAKVGIGSSLQKKLKFDTHFEVPAQGLRGGLIILWNTNLHEVTIQHHTDKVGSNSDCIDRILKFRENWNRCNLLDAGYVGSKFTWTRHLQGRVILQERLDRMLYNIDMVDFFPKLRVVTLTRIYSDHNPILVNMELEIPMDKDKRPFRFEASWLTRDEFNTVFSSAWDKKKNSLVDAETVHSVTNLKGRKGAVITKIDLQKAYDNVSWEFLKKTLQDFNFPGKLIKVIIFCIMSSTIEPLWNREMTESFNPKQGLRQEYEELPKRIQSSIWSLGKYLKQKEFLEVETRGNSSSTWRGLLRTGKEQLKNLYPLMNNPSRNEEVYIDENRSWNISEIQHLISEETRMEIQRVQISVLADPQEHDKIIWGFTKDGKFTVTSAYQAITNMEMEFGYMDFKNWLKRNCLSKKPGIEDLEWGSLFMVAISGLATAGGLIRDSKGYWKIGFMLRLGRVNNSIAEIWEARQGLILAKILGLRNLILEMDAKWVVNLFNGERMDDPSDIDLSVWLADTDFDTNLQEFITTVQEWNVEFFGHIRRTKRLILARLRGIKRALHSYHSDYLCKLETRLREDYDETTQNKITALKNDDRVWCTEGEELKNLAVNFYKKLFQIENRGAIHYDRGRFPCVPRDKMDMLAMPLSDEEVRIAIFDMAPLKSPGIDGIHAVFYQKNWQVVDPMEDLQHMLRSCPSTLSILTNVVRSDKKSEFLHTSVREWIAINLGKDRGFVRQPETGIYYLGPSSGIYGSKGTQFFSIHRLRMICVEILWRVGGLSDPVAASSCWVGEGEFRWGSGETLRAEIWGMYLGLLGASEMGEQRVILEVDNLDAINVVQ
ncbi:hypothetical protein F3Y22_tig00006038pilonHSYRG00002 [Hibiscus syriacus]|uniref:CCHC-type domain-containing protein n=1 Tax=Hibiscus syriacus TaxID=106335 RepID=A0A6A3CHQ0_HIBSY|nr:hypothetical protein F3Y22_tig00006038pilonHSYRG00002 [Hibiscus syriacus]